MKKIKIQRFLKSYILIISLLFLSVSCVEYEALPFNGYILPRRSGYVNEVTNDWIYYNLKTGDIFNGKKVHQHIKEGEQKERLNWDLAFCGFALRTNGGTSGKGQGAVADLGKINYDALQKVPKDLTWIKDNEKVKITMAKRDWVSYSVKNGLTNVPWFDPNKGPKRVNTDASPLLSRAISFSGPPPSYLPNLHVYLVKSANGKDIYKIQIISWYNTNIEIGDTGGRISFYCEKLN